jgi:hypothetical protein
MKDWPPVCEMEGELPLRRVCRDKGYWFEKL